ncbi:uncharacterized protein [Halyomorpha halys]|uniref:uncharacterized protein n=1 Tax=Halyomorpha halys TaxID=286706 RepID=UPI0006D4FA42|nr:uncharacterized protein LOC106680877 [Halyomorpha halys]
MAMLSYIVLGLFAVGALADTVVINEAVDQLLDSAKFVLVQKGQNKIALKDLTKNFNTKIFGVNVPGTFAASAGLVQDLATLHRTGDVVLTTEGAKMQLKFAMGFERLSLEYGHYDFKFMSIVSNGRIDVSTAGSSVAAAIGVLKDGTKCIASADSAQLVTLGETKITFTGPQVLNQFLSMVLNWVLENFDSTIKVVVNAKLQEALKAGLAKTDICARLPH